MSPGSTCRRAERLRVLLAIAGEEPALTPIDALLHDLPRLSEDDYDLLAEATPDDKALAYQLCRVGAELRAREYHALEQLLGLLPGGPTSLDAHVLGLPLPHRVRAISAVLDLGWINQ